MAKVFRIFRDLGDHKSNWFTSFQIGTTAVDSITVQETEGKKLPTSIPSPFAQMDLVRAAFNNVCEEFIKGVDLNEPKDSHRIVSNALDIGQILFNYDTNASNLSIDYWDKNTHLNSIKESTNPKLQHLGKTLELFLTSSDSDSYNFNKMDRIFILKYNNRVIGGTSPKTLFFASADATKIKIDIYAGNDKMLDDQPLALYKRDKDYIRYWFYLKSLPNFNTLFPEVSDYLSKTLTVIGKNNINFQNELISLEKGDSFQDLTLPDNQGLAVEPLPGIRLKKVIPKDPTNSGFKIHTKKQIERPPLVLPVDTFTEKLLYTNDIWNSNINVPFYDNKPLAERKLPVVNDKYPYLTINDFLSDTLVKLPYKIDGKFYYTQTGFENFLLPIKSLFFDYFTVNDILEQGLINFNKFGSEDIEVTLKIPIQDGLFITYTKKYSKSSNIDLSRLNIGKIKEFDFTLGIYPFVKSENIKIDYSISISESEKIKGITNIQPVLSNHNSEVETRVRDRSTSTSPFSTYYLTNAPFDYLLLKIQVDYNLVIPKLREYTNTGLSYHFAIDFGTTNTHIEYKTSSNNLPANFEHENEHFVFLRNLDVDFKGEISVESKKREELLNQEVLHNDLGKNKYEFPFRSVLLENDTINYNNPNYLFSDVNIGFDYEKSNIRKHLQVVPNLKWLHLNQNNNNQRVEMYIKQLLMLCKNKVLMTKGNLVNTKIIWLFPTSMTYNQRKQFNDIWAKQFEECFGVVPNSTNFSSVPESLAPFYYYINRGGELNQTKPTVSIDIGGGTTDVTIFEENRPTLLTSFRFAGEDIFGDGYSNNINNNGFIKKFYGVIKKKLTDNTHIAVEELSVLDTIYQKNNSVDVINFLFSLKENYNLTKNQVDVDFETLLKENQDIKIIFLLFYSSIIYHIAQLMHFNGKDIPKTILFSGTAAKSLNILDSGQDRFKKLLNLIFNKVYSSNDSSIEIKLDKSPKILTAKGAIYANTNYDIDELIKTYLGQALDKSSAEKVNYSAIDNNITDNVIENLNSYYELLDELNTELNFNNSFGISSKSYSLFKSERNNNSKDYLLKGIDNRKIDVVDANESIDEPLFFYPLKGFINELASKLNDN